MGHTGISAEIFTITVPEQLEADYESPVSHADLARVVDNETEAVPDGKYVDADLQGNDALGL